MIDYGHVTEGTPTTWEDTQAAMQLARGVANEGIVYIRQSRCVSNKGHGYNS